MPALVISLLRADTRHFHEGAATWEPSARLAGENRLAFPSPMPRNAGQARRHRHVIEPHEFRRRARDEFLSLPPLHDELYLRSFSAVTVAAAIASG